MVSFRDINGVLEVRHRHEVIRIQAWGTDSVRVRAAQYRWSLRHGVWQGTEEFSLAARALQKAGFYKEWRGKYGEDAFAILEKGVGKLP